MEQPYATIKQAKEEIPAGTTKIYEWIGDGTLDAFKLGRRTLISRASIKRLHANLPKLVTPSGKRLSLEEQK